MTEETRKHEVHASEILQFGITKLGLIFVALYKTGATRLHQEPVVQTMTGTSHWINPRQIEIQLVWQAVYNPLESDLFT